MSQIVPADNWFCVFKINNEDTAYQRVAAWMLQDDGDVVALIGEIECKPTARLVRAPEGLLCHKDDLAKYTSKSSGFSTF